MYSPMHNNRPEIFTGTWYYIGELLTAGDRCKNSTKKLLVISKLVVLLTLFPGQKYLPVILSGWDCFG